MLCADLMQIEWQDASGQKQGACANLEDISNSGACVQLDGPVPVDACVRITAGKLELEGRVRYCVFRDTGYFAGVQFDPGTKWKSRLFRPKHLLDPRRLVRATLRRALKNGKPSEPRP